MQYGVQCAALPPAHGTHSLFDMVASWSISLSLCNGFPLSCPMHVPGSWCYVYIRIVHSLNLDYHPDGRAPSGHFSHHMTLRGNVYTTSSLCLSKSCAGTFRTTQGKRAHCKGVFACICSDDAGLRSIANTYGRLRTAETARSSKDLAPTRK